MSTNYDEYLVDHIGGVKKAFSWLCEKFPDISEKMSPYRYIIDQHDNSKYRSEEYEAYDRYFYGGNRSFEVVNEFNLAWLKHIHCNPHHWQYWILAQDDGPEKILEMPYQYVIEMICDWWSFSWKSGHLREIFDWYEKHKGMKLNPKTRKLVEDILKRIKEKLDEEEASFSEDDAEGLEHHGIKGQRWGVRRFQNPDGSLTPAGRIRYGVEDNLDSDDRKRMTENYDDGNETSFYYKNSFDRQIKEGLSTNDKPLEKIEDLKKLPSSRFHKKKIEDDAISHINDDDGVGFNCQNCAAARELVKRGYDVSARSRYVGSNGGDVLSYFKNAEVKKTKEDKSLNDAIEKLASYNEKNPTLDTEEKEKTFETLLNKVYSEKNRVVGDVARDISSFGKNSRGIILVGFDRNYYYKNKSTTSMYHAMNFEVDKKGKVNIFDAQSDLSTYAFPLTFDGICDKIGDRVDPRSIYYFRTDNLELDPSITSAVYSRN